MQMLTAVVTFSTHFSRGTCLKIEPPWTPSICRVYVVTFVSMCGSTAYTPRTLRMQSWSAKCTPTYLLHVLVFDLTHQGLYPLRRLRSQWVQVDVRFEDQPLIPFFQVGTYGSLAALAGSDIVMSIVLALVLYQHRSVFPR